MSNPGVQDCGAPVVYAITGRGNTRLLRPSDAAATDDFLALREQTPCNELVDRRMQQGWVALGAFLVLATTGATLGLVDDRLRLRRAPKFERLLRERPEDAPGAIWDQPVVPRQEIGQKLPEMEASDVESFVVWSAVSVCILLIVAGVSQTLDAFADARVVPIILAILFASASRVVAGALLSGVESGLLERGGRLDRAARVMVACDFAGRLRPAFGAIGVQSHALVRRGVDRGRALVDVGVMVTVTALVHAALLALLFLLTLAISPNDGSWPPHEVMLLLLAAGVAIAGAVVLPARLRRLPCILGRRTLDRLVERWTRAPIDVMAMALLSGVMVLLQGFVLVAGVSAFGDDFSVVPILFVAVVALAFGAFSPLPDGLVGADVVMLLGLTLVGVDAVAAVAAILSWRLVTTWLPMLPGYLMTRRLIAQGTL